MWVNLTEQSVQILLSEEEVQTLRKGEPVIGSPTSAFPIGSKILIVRQAGIEEIRAKYDATP
ncbi:hypothetical protein ES703_49850 [subsurface metagenome]